MPTPSNRSLPVCTSGSLKFIVARSISLWRPSDSWKASSASSSALVGRRKSSPSTRFIVFVKCWMTAPVANACSEPLPGAPSPDQPVASRTVLPSARVRASSPSGLTAVETRRPSVCGTPRSTPGRSKPSAFSSDQAEPAHQLGILELREVRVELRHEQRVVIRQGRDERGIDGEVVGRRVTAGAGTAVAVEGLLHEQLAPPFDQPSVGRVGLGRCDLRDKDGEYA